MSAPKGFDYERYIESPTTSDWQRLHGLVGQLRESEQTVARLRGELARAEHQLRDVQERQLPEMMEAMGVSEFTDSTGLVVKVKEGVRAHISEEHAAEAYSWMRTHGYDSIIKNVVSVQLGKGEDERANVLLRKLREDGYQPQNKISVHPSTLEKFVREMLEAGSELPQDIFGVHRYRVAKVSAIREK